MMFAVEDKTHGVKDECDAIHANRKRQTSFPKIVFHLELQLHVPKLQ